MVGWCLVPKGWRYIRLVEPQQPRWNHIDPVWTFKWKIRNVRRDRPRSFTKHKSHLQSSVFCLNQIKITHSTENHIFYGQSKWILIWSTNKNVMKDKSLNVPATLDIAPRKITKHKSHLQSSVFCLNRIKKAHSTENHIFYGQSKWILIWSTNKNVMKDKSLNVPATLDIAPRKITKHKSHLQSSVFCLNRIKITHSTENDIFYSQSKWILIWSTNKDVMKDKSLNVPATLDIAPQENHKTQISSSIVCFLLESNKNYTFNRKSHFLQSIQVDFDLKHK